MAMASPTSLVYYSAVAKGVVVLAEHVVHGNTDWSAIAACCLENIPPFHSRFSYTTNQRRFVCILDGIFTYCAIMDEGLSKAEAFSFLQKTRDAFKNLHKGRGPDSETLTLGAHLLDEEMVPIMRQHAEVLVGLPQREKIRREMELQAERDAVMEPEVSSPTAEAPSDEREESEERKQSDDSSSNKEQKGSCKQGNYVKISVKGVGGLTEMDGSIHFACYVGFAEACAALVDFAVGLSIASPQLIVDCLLACFVAAGWGSM